MLLHSWAELISLRLLRALQMMGPGAVFISSLSTGQKKDLVVVLVDAAALFPLCLVGLQEAGGQPTATGLGWAGSRNVVVSGFQYSNCFLVPHLKKPAAPSEPWH